MNGDYDPNEIGKIKMNKKGKQIIIRKHHLTDDEIISTRNKFKLLIKDVPKEIKDKAGMHFFNPYRTKGIYFIQIQALYLLGANEWHSYIEVKNKIREYASKIILVKRENGKVRKTDVWTEFNEKTSRNNSITSKDIYGRITENMLLLQRLNKLNPYGYKLKQAHAAIDIKIVPHNNLPNGLLYYRLSTYNTIEEAIPLKCNREIVFENDEIEDLIMVDESNEKEIIQHSIYKFI